MMQKMILASIKPFLPAILEMAPGAVEAVQAEIIKKITETPLEDGEGRIGIQGFEHQGQLYLNIVAFNPECNAILRVIRAVNLTKLSDVITSPEVLETIKRDGFGAIPKLLSNQF